MGYVFRVWFGESFETLHPATGPENKNKLLAGGDCIRTAKRGDVRGRDIGNRACFRYSSGLPTMDQRSCRRRDEQSVLLLTEFSFVPVKLSHVSYMVFKIRNLA